jgi:hypothetical protein
MNLFVNVFITDQRWSNSMYSNLSNERKANTKLEIFKYMLASYSVIKWSKAFFYIQLDENYKSNKDELSEYIYDLFPKTAVLYDKRLETYEEWKSAIELLDVDENEWLWFTCNDDHPFIDSSLDHLKICLEACKQISEKTKKHVSIFPTHWQEMMAEKKRARILNNKKSHQLYTPNSDIIYDEKNYYVTTRTTCASLQILTKKHLKTWFQDKSSCPEDLRRTDTISPPENQLTLIPYKELVRHFDVYSHSGLSHEIIPPMFIPNGFFDKKTKIQYGGDERLDGYYYIHPQKPMYSDEMGYESRVSNSYCDSNIIIDELPLFWEDRIIDKFITKISDEEERVSYIKQKLLEVCADPRFGFRPTEAINEVKQVFMQKYNVEDHQVKIISDNLMTYDKRFAFEWKRLKYSYIKTYLFPYLIQKKSKIKKQIKTTFPLLDRLI